MIGRVDLTFGELIYRAIEKRKYFLISIAFSSLLAAGPIWAGTVYYVDSAVADTHVASGTPDFTTYNHLTFETTGGTDAVYKTIADLNAKTFSAGDTICFRKGQTWTGSSTSSMLDIHHSGAAGNYITFTSFGTGDKPIIENSCTTASYKKAIYINANYIIIDGLQVQKTVDRGIDVPGSYNIFRNCEATNVGSGIFLTGSHNLVTLCYFHDLNMVVNTPTPTNDDYGCGGVTVQNTDCEVSYCTFKNLLVTCYDYGYLGRCLELFGNISRLYAHNNFAYNCLGFFELGASTPTTISDVLLSYNVTAECGRFSGINNSPGDYECTPINFRVFNNTLVSTSACTIPIKYAGIIFDQVGSTGQFIFRNNILWLDGWQIVAQTWTTFDHDHNLFYLRSGTRQNVTPDETDITGSDPLFVNVGGTSAADYRLQPGSPCINTGKTVPGMVYDFDGKPVPSGAATDIGAYEYVGQFYPPAVTTLAATSITSTSATVGENVTSDGGATVTERGVCWGLTENPAISGFQVKTIWTQPWIKFLYRLF